jgi:hypothetical protein
LDERAEGNTTFKQLKGDAYEEGAHTFGLLEEVANMMTSRSSRKRSTPNKQARQIRTVHRRHAINDRQLMLTESEE